MLLLLFLFLFGNYASSHVYMLTQNGSFFLTQLATKQETAANATDNSPLPSDKYKPHGIKFELVVKGSFTKQDELPYPIVEQV